jgi:hypothetical protein
MFLYTISVSAAGGYPTFLKERKKMEKNSIKNRKKNKK